MTSTSVGKKIELARREKGWSQETLGSRISRSRNTINRWEKGHISPGHDDLIRIAEATGKLLAFFLEDGTTQFIPATSISRMIPVFDASCGQFIDWTDGGYPSGISNEMMDTDSKDRHAFYVRAHGESMTGRADDRRTIYDGDKLLVEPSKDVVDGDLVLCRDESRGVTVKKFKKYTETIDLIPLNDSFQRITITPKNQIRCFKITEIRRKL